MRKVSEILKLSLDTYKKTSDRFMCCVVDDNYVKEDKKRLNFTSEERYVTRNLIRAEILGHVTLDTYLAYVSDEYAEIKFSLGYRSEKAAAIRLQFWYDLIAKLEQLGE